MGSKRIGVTGLSLTFQGHVISSTV